MVDGLDIVLFAKKGALSREWDRTSYSNRGLSILRKKFAIYVMNREKFLHPDASSRNTESSVTIPKNSGGLKNNHGLKSAQKPSLLDDTNFHNTSVASASVVDRLLQPTRSRIAHLLHARSASDTTMVNNNDDGEVHRHASECRGTVRSRLHSIVMVGSVH